MIKMIVEEINAPLRETVPRYAASEPSVAMRYVNSSTMRALAIPDKMKTIERAILNIKARKEKMRIADPT